ncbi:MAG TPA: ABC transporter permease [Gemmatimonadaceae bacterium]
MRWPFGPGAARDADLDDEIRAHFAMAIAERIKRGESPEEATAAARREFGNVAHVKEVTRETWGGLWLERLAQDVRFTFRSLRRSPGFTTVAVLTFALAIGVNTTMFTVVNGILFRPLPFRGENELFVVSHAPGGPFINGPAMFDATYDAYARSQHAFQSTTSYTIYPATMTGVGDPTRISVSGSSPGFFRVLGVSPARGRDFTPAEQLDSADSHAVISDGLWRNRFASDPNVVGRTLELDGVRQTIIGVMPPEFDVPSGTRIWKTAPIYPNPHRVSMRVVVGRLARGATPVAALSEMQAFAKAFEQPRSDLHIEQAVDGVTPIRRAIVGDVRRSLVLFEGAVAFVLLIACANVANLLLMRTASRQHEITIRTALGAGRGRLIRQFLTESVVIALLGGALGVGIAMAGVPALVAAAPADLLPRSHDIRIDWTVLAVTAGVCVLAGIVFGVAPALQSTRRAVRASLAESGQAATSPRAALRSTIVILELALALVLLVGAGLMTRSFLRMRAVNVGFNPEHVVTFTVDLPQARYPTAAALHDFRRRTESALRSIPNLEAIAAVNWRPMSTAAIRGDFQLDGGRKRPSGFIVLKPCVTADYFRVMGIKLRRGRAFAAGDDEAAPRVAIVSTAVAAKIWPGEDALGKRLSMSDEPGPNDWLTVVGVVDDIVQNGLTAQPSPAIYEPLAQVDFAPFIDHLAFVARTDADPTVVEREFLGVLKTVDPLQAAQSVGTMTSLVMLSIAEPVFQMRLLALFSILAVVLAAIGIYGVLAAAVSERSREFGIRMALGASPPAVVRLVLRRTALLSIVGVALGLAAATGVTRVLTKFLFGVEPTDPLTFAIVTAALVATAFVAALVPARRASRIDPLIAIRHE